MERSYSKRCRAILRPLVDLVLPPLCFGCGARLPASQKYLCAQCLAAIQKQDEDICDVCGSSLSGGHCPFCLDTEALFWLARAPYMYLGGIRNLIHSFKYESYPMIGKWFAHAMADVIDSEPSFQDCDVITPVPLHFVRKRERGYNQSEIIARELSKLVGIDYAVLCKRHRHTKSQTHLNKQEREHNLDRAFSLCRGKDVANAKVLLIDDVFTTGTTVNKISELFLENGASSVSVLTAARAV